MKNVLAKTVIADEVIKLIAKEYNLSLLDATEMFYKSDISDLLEDDKTGLYGESPLYVFSIFKEKHNNN